MLPDRLTAPFQTERGRRVTAVVVTVLLEVLILLALLTLGRGIHKPVPMADQVSTFDARDYSEPKPPEPEQPEAKPQTAPRPSPLTPPPPPVPTPTPAATIPVNPTPAPPPQPQVPAPATGPRPIQPIPPGANAYGPQMPNRQPDSRRIGTAANGQPLYAAAWYRRPTDSELRGYLSTAQPGWAIINCRTVPDWRVDDCVSEGEYPQGAGMARAVLAAAWQFRVRPPMLGGKYQIGEWVRIRIEYSMSKDQFDY